MIGRIIRCRGRPILPRGWREGCVSVQIVEVVSAAKERVVLVERIWPGRVWLGGIL